MDGRFGVPEGTARGLAGFWKRFRCLPTPPAMTRLSLMAAVGFACLASTVLLARTAPAPEGSILDRVYS